MNQIYRRFRRRMARTPLRPIVVNWRHRRMQPNDVLIAGFPKSGNTWLTHMLVNLLTEEEQNSWDSTRNLVPSVGRDIRNSGLSTSRGRLLKTHEPYRLDYKQSLYVVRDIRDVAVSSFFFVQRRTGQRIEFDTFLEGFLDGQIFPYGSWQDHVRSWIDSEIHQTPDMLIVRYEDLHADGVHELNRVCEFFDIDASPAALESTMAANSFSAMRNLEKATARMQTMEKETGIPFVRKGTAGQWKEHFTAIQVERCKQAAGDVMEQLGYEM